MSEPCYPSNMGYIPHPNYGVSPPLSIQNPQQYTGDYLMMPSGRLVRVTSVEVDESSNQVILKTN